MQFLIGTSAFSVKEWKGNFYPEKLPLKQMLHYYSQHFATVEINNSFRRMPTVSVVESWAQQTPDSFRFALKAPQSITHFRRLKNVDEPLNQLLQAVSVLKKRRGPILFQLPANFKKDVSRLDAFLSLVAKRAAVAFEFRHESWFDDEVYDCLRSHSCGLCCDDADDVPQVGLVNTTDWGYVRLRREDYPDRSLRAWIKRMKSQDWKKVYVFFKHEDTGTGPKFATRLLKLAGAKS